jgi:hypothetical protein
MRTLKTAGGAPRIWPDGPEVPLIPFGCHQAPAVVPARHGGALFGDRRDEGACKLNRPGITGLSSVLRALIVPRARAIIK